MGDSGILSLLSLIGAYSMDNFFHSPFSFENTSPFCTLSNPVAHLGIYSSFSHERTSFPILYKKQFIILLPPPQNISCKGQCLSFPIISLYFLCLQLAKSHKQYVPTLLLYFLLGSLLYSH